MLRMWLGGVSSVIVRFGTGQGRQRGHCGCERGSGREDAHAVQGRGVIMGVSSDGGASTPRSSRQSSEEL